MPSFQYLSKLEQYTNRVFEAFDAYLVEDTQFTSLFKEHDDIKSLLAKQKANFIKTLEMDYEDIEKNSLDLGKLHYDLGISYISFTHGMDILEKSFSLHIANEESCQDLLKELVEYFQIVKSYSAKGYLKRILKKDRQEFDTYKVQLKMSETYLPKSIILDKVEWLTNLMSLIEHNRSFSHTIHKISKEWFKETKEVKTQVIFLEGLDDHIQTTIHNLFYFLKQKEYHKVLSLYSTLIGTYKLMLTMSESIHLKWQNQETDDPKIQLFDDEELFNEILFKEFAFQQRDNAYTFSVIYISCDNFETIKNDYGEVNANRVLEEISDTIGTHIRTSDYGFHFEENKFAVILKNAKRYIAKKITKKIATDFNEYRFFFNEDIVHASMCAGITEQSHSYEHDTIEELINEVEQNLLRAQEFGNNQIYL
ncbi:MAG: diguanylate cyclase [Campylobacterota bacterium]|nr:diguanylate cyclase [Campylobacterota bacterium]